MLQLQQGDVLLIGPEYKARVSHDPGYFSDLSLHVVSHLKFI